MANKYYITTPIYYVNDVPHLGHAYTTIAADVLARNHKLLGDEVFLLTGTDEHGAKIAEAAKKAGKSPKEFVDSLVPRFQSTWKNLNIGYDQFIRTTDPKHESVVLDLVSKLQKKGFVEKRKYEGLYCVSCERFYTKNELVDGKCPDHKRECVKHSEENYFFLLEKAAKKFDLLGKIKSDEIKVSPESRKNEVLGKIKTGLEDVSISRENVSWGIKFPGDPSQTIYVWVDALINYYTATKIYKNGPTWPADIHLMAKDILWFHAIVWPAILLALGEKTPKNIFAHGYFTIAGEKMSKTIGNVIDPNAVVEKYHNPDVLRYALLREFPFGEDGDISDEKIEGRYEIDLGNELGNLVQRTISMINRYEVKVGLPEVLSIDKDQGARLSSVRALVSEQINALKFSEALETIWKVARDLNAEIERSKPWEMAKNEPENLSETLSFIYENIYGIAELLAPFMPGTCEKIKKQLKKLEPEPLFPRLGD